MKHLRPTLSALILCATGLPSAWAHEGHGLPGMTHWHSTDVLGFVAVVALVAAVSWLRGGK